MLQIDSVAEDVALEIHYVYLNPHILLYDCRTGKFFHTFP